MTHIKNDPALWGTVIDDASGHGLYSRRDLKQAPESDPYEDARLVNVKSFIFLVLVG